MIDFQAILSEFPDLRLHEVNGTRDLALVGAFPVRLRTGEEVGRFILHIRIPMNPSTGIPKVWETGGRIRRDSDHHCLEDGSLCVFLREERYLYYPIGSPLVSFLKGPLNSYLFGQLHVEEFNCWPFPEWKHGVLGRADFYREHFGIPKAIADALIRILTEVKQGSYRRHLPCPCGSGRKTKNCHWVKLHELQVRVEPKVLESALTEFPNFQKYIDEGIVTTEASL